MSSPEHNDRKFEALAQALRRAEEREPVFIPPALDEAILRQARRHLEGKPKDAWHFRLFALLTTATAVIALAIFLNRPAQNFAHQDVNRDGQIDILDALALANELNAAQSAAAHDQNRDGKIDAADIDAIAMAAVRLDQKEGI